MCVEISFHKLLFVLDIVLKCHTQFAQLQNSGGNSEF